MSRVPVQAVWWPCLDKEPTLNPKGTLQGSLRETLKTLQKPLKEASDETLHLTPANPKL